MFSVLPIPTSQKILHELCVHDGEKYTVSASSMRVSRRIFFKRLVYALVSNSIFHDVYQSPGTIFSVSAIALSNAFARGDHLLAWIHEIPFLFYSGEPGCRAQHSFSDAVEASSAGARLDKERCVEIGFHVMKGKRFRGIHGS